eukprot:2282557-Prymnesium_polylepis.1
MITLRIVDAAKELALRIEYIAERYGGIVLCSTSTADCSKARTYSRASWSGSRLEFEIWPFDRQC